MQRSRAAVLLRDTTGTSAHIEGLFIAFAATVVGLSAALPLATVAGGRFVETEPPARQRIDSADPPGVQQVLSPTGSDPRAAREREAHFDDLEPLTSAISVGLSDYALRPLKRLAWVGLTLVPLDWVRELATWRGIDASDVEAYERYRAPIEDALATAMSNLRTGVSDFVESARNDLPGTISARTQNAIAPFVESPGEAALALAASPFVMIYTRVSDWGTLLWAEDDADSAQAAARLGPGMVADVGATILGAAATRMAVRRAPSVVTGVRYRWGERGLHVAPNVRLLDAKRDWDAFNRFLKTDPRTSALLPPSWNDRRGGFDVHAPKAEKAAAALIPGGNTEHSWYSFFESVAALRRQGKHPTDQLFVHTSKKGRGGDHEIDGGALIRTRAHESSHEIVWVAADETHVRNDLLRQMLAAARKRDNRPIRVTPRPGHTEDFTGFADEGFLPTSIHGEYEISAIRTREILRTKPQATQAPSE